MADVSSTQIWQTGAQLRTVNQQIKAGLIEAGRVALSDRNNTEFRNMASALRQLQTEYVRAAELYTTVYRAVYGEVPQGLGVILAAVPLAAWLTLGAALAVIYRYSSTLETAMNAWRERLRVRVIQELPPEERADALRKTLPPVNGDFLSWVERNLPLVLGIGAIGVIALRR